MTTELHIFVAECCNDFVSSLTIFVLKEEWRPAALQLSSCHDCDAVGEQVGLVHKVRGEQDGATALLPLQEVPGGTSS